VELVDQAAYNALTLCQHDHHVRIYSYCLIGILMLSFSPMNIHPAKITKKKGSLDLANPFFRCAEGNPRAVEATVAGTHVQF
jgi:hypothetical protein